MNTCNSILPGKCRINIQFLVKFKKSATKTFQILTEAYGYETLSPAHVFEWHEKFSVGRVSVEDDETAESQDSIGLTWEHDILVLNPSSCLTNGSQVYDWMGLDKWNSWFKSQVRDSNRSQNIADLNKF
ncbi:uncharacterized protein TNCV_3503751 [Trichonephila clavipes]|uniref:Mos1 transposase HTH domain-containing protein n=1 Tax=Trichonephila clavipes TaxID=2585209 RepID=A0A8X6V7T1_TRICX|nr:uncharacterized protein TNCV_3503751 [Trichonephila clavipes]